MRYPQTYEPPEKILLNQLSRVSEFQNPPSLRRQISLGKETKLGNLEARSILIISAIKFAYREAKKWHFTNLPFEDRLQEGCVGLCIAVDKYDPDRGFAFLTYASWWIRQSIQRACVKSRSIIHVPEGNNKEISRINKYISSYENENENGHFPSEEDIQKHFGFSDKQMGRYRDSIIAAKAQSLHLLLHGESRHYVYEPATNPRALDLLVMKAEKIQRVRNALSQLPERLQRILEGRSSGMTLEEVAEGEGVTRERIRQLEAKALMKLANKLGRFSPKMSLAQAMQDTSTEFV